MSKVYFVQGLDMNKTEKDRNKDRKYFLPIKKKPQDNSYINRQRVPEWNNGTPETDLLRTSRATLLATISSISPKNRTPFGHYPSSFCT